MERYQKIEKNGQVGAGTYGVVYKAKDKQNNDSIVALKVPSVMHIHGYMDTHISSCILNTLELCFRVNLSNKSQHDSYFSFIYMYDLLFIIHSENSSRSRGRRHTEHDTERNCSFTSAQAPKYC
jgi:serine/threonine protein kinase